MTIAEKHREFCKKYNKELIYYTYYKYHKQWYSDEKLSKMDFKVWWPKGKKKNSLLQQWLNWKKETWRTNCYDWYRTRINEWRSLDYDYFEHTIKSDWINYNKHNDYISYSSYHNKFAKPKQVEVKQVEVDREVKTKLDLTNVEVGDDYYYNTL